MEGRAYAVPATINYTPDSPDLDERRGQLHRSAMVKPRPGGTAFVITVTSAPSKFNDWVQDLRKASTMLGQTAYFNYHLLTFLFHPYNSKRLNP